ncbi:MAG: hypothetical protein P8M80_10250 [Pirellulaceae bacterium]|jgi:hypothetical protein|nr:hypothetical protein [Pirellulaceae bacterium]
MKADLLFGRKLDDSPSFLWSVTGSLLGRLDPRNGGKTFSIL